MARFDSRIYAVSAMQGMTTPSAEQGGHAVHTSSHVGFGSCGRCSNMLKYTTFPTAHNSGNYYGLIEGEMGEAV